MRRYAAGAVAAVLVALAVVLRPARALDALRVALASPWFPAILVGLYAVRPFLAWPISALSLLVGFRYGLAVGVPIALTGAVATSLPAYAAGRYAPVDGRLLGRFSAGSERFFAATGDVRGLVAARFAPTPAEPVSAAAGAGSVGLGSFVVGTVVGELPWVVGTVFVGSGLDALSMTGASVSPAFVVAGCVAAAALLGPVAYRRVVA
ncbi:TVP38/TMEM64 family protein [Halobacterium rubrum]|uniref:TVP38/TMEM64 family protein n=1 Tax=Halobacterium TaxID=2239 RepID=UPI001F189CC1|nr:MULTISPECIES: VTT domain-containing protein [Halobacterium]MDH5019600.1 VTT domain-containing protein [Halobacterium rubrum]